MVNVNGRDRVLNPGPLSRRPDKSTTTPRSDIVVTLSYNLDQSSKFWPSGEICEISQMFFELQKSQHPLIGKFKNWVEMKDRYPTNK
jgi:hypothetical protein